ncbi:MAG: diaminopimelate epimerase [Nitrospirae bacterium]|nr:diaminopimelate epimerase [Nitrospirota bacterium]MBF0539908.1 diaminopimelate epimerase [Nitrospirota bacterium]
MNFTKMHGIGNDFILIDCLNQETLQTCSDLFWVDFSIQYCERRKGIGADQLLLLLPSKIGDYRMRIFNSSGGEVEMCGNGIRCLAQYIWDNNLSDNDVLNIETLAGIIKPKRNGDLITVDMGLPKLEGAVINKPFNISDKTFLITTVSMGNPHAVILVDDVPSFPVAVYGPLIETNDFFPKKTNVEFIKILDKQTIQMRVWERGAGETLACGTGASAAAVASRLLGHTGNNVKVILTGGDLDIEWDGKGSVYMTGPAVSVFKGTL